MFVSLFYLFLCLFIVCKNILLLVLFSIYFITNRSWSLRVVNVKRATSVHTSMSAKRARQSVTCKSKRFAAWSLVATVFNKGYN